MYHNYFFLKRLALELNERLRGGRVVECFSQNKEELIIGIDVSGEDHFIKANLQPKVCALYFSDSFQRARKNSVDLFPQLINRTIRGVAAFENERSFYIKCDDDFEFIFKMHGSRSNIILLESKQTASIFKSNLKQDFSLTPSDLNRKVPQSETEYSADGLKSFPHLGKEVMNHFFSSGSPVSWSELQGVLNILESNPINIYHTTGSPPRLHLFDSAEVAALRTTSAIQASNFYFDKLVRFIDLDENKYALIWELESRIRKSESYISKNKSKLAELKQKRSYSQLGDLVMANLHLFTKGTQAVDVIDFYTGNPITLRLKPDMSPQAYAETLYRKAKNQHVEIETLEKNIREKEDTLLSLEATLRQIKATEDQGQLKNWTVGIKKEVQEETLQYHKFEHKGYTILVGKTAQSNDYLTQKIATKNDLWLHARDVPGSHVIIRQKPGQNFPAEVIEKAAEMAAWNSKRKTDSLCPVIYTEKKFVRKVKGAPPGQVKVEREKVIMVTPTASLL